MVIAHQLSTRSSLEGASMRTPPSDSNATSIPPSLLTTTPTSPLATRLTRSFPVTMIGRPTNQRRARRSCGSRAPTSASILSSQSYRPSGPCRVAARSLIRPAAASASSTSPWRALVARSTPASTSCSRTCVDAGPVGVEHPPDVGMPGAEDVHDGIGIPPTNRLGQGGDGRIGTEAVHPPEHGHPPGQGRLPGPVVGARLPRRARPGPRGPSPPRCWPVGTDHPPAPTVLRAAARRAAGPSAAATPSRSRR